MFFTARLSFTAWSFSGVLTIETPVSSPLAGRRVSRSGFGLLGYMLGSDPTVLGSDTVLVGDLDFKFLTLFN